MAASGSRAPLHSTTRSSARRTSNWNAPMRTTLPSRLQSGED
jgi:hypothetical protein